MVGLRRRPSIRPLLLQLLLQAEHFAEVRSMLA